MIERAPAKINLCLFLGPTRADGRHELVTVVDALDFGDDLAIELADEDVVVCPGVAGTNLAATALAGFRGRFGGSPLRLTITKRTPVAAGMSGGSSDAGAALRVAAGAAGVDDEAELLRIAATIGADVPALVRPGRVLATGAGEHVERLAPPPPFGIVVAPASRELPTAEVFAEADRLGLSSDGEVLGRRLDEVRAAVGEGRFGLADALIVNELEPAALALAPEIAETLAALHDAGAAHALVSGSGPTAVGLFGDRAAAEAAAGALSALRPRPFATGPLEAAA